MKTAGCISLCLILSFLLISSGCSSSVKEPGTSAASVTSPITLTQSEKDFIKAHPVINLGVDPKFIPYEFIDTDGVYKGIAADYIDLICKKTGLQMVIAKNLTWTDAYDKAVNRELDVLPCVSKTTDREKYFLFSDPYYAFERAVYINKSNNTIKSFSDLNGTTAAVQANSSHYSYLLEFPSIKLSQYPTVLEALKAVSDGKETSFVGNFATSNYLIKANGITNLKYFKVASQEPSSLYFAVRTDWPELVSILNKAVGSISEEEKITINNKWLGIDSSADYSGLIRNLEITGIVLAIVFTVSVFWILRLRREIAIRIKTQEELHAAKEDAERANQIKSLFLARMSHEIRTPLNAITGMGYLLKKTDMTITQGIYLDKLTQAAKNMLGIINDILDFSKIEAGKIEIEKISFDLDKVLERVITIVSVKVEEQGIDFSMEKDPVMPAAFFGDPMRIEQILINLLNNAIKFTENGFVSLSVHVLSIRDNAYRIEFCVKDSGIGMSPEQVRRIFIPFDQGDSSINRRFGGTGLGLSIVKNLTDLMGGAVTVESKEGKGSAFCIQLPLESDPSKEQVYNKKMAADCFRGVHALVLDNNEITSKILENCFSSFGISYDFASTEEDALLLMSKPATENNRLYNLLVIDYATPKGNGFEFWDRLQKSSVFSTLPKSMLIIPLGREELYDEIESAGIDFGITRPIMPSVLYNDIIEIFRIEPPEALKPAKKPADFKAPYPYRLLLVEDNKTNQFIAGTILEQAGFRVSKANNGEEGYRYYKNNRKDIDLILMDIHMPVMDGYAASDLIRKIDKDVPIIAMTADAVAGVKEQCRSHGLNQYVSKPFEPEQFIAVILDVLKDKVIIVPPDYEPSAADSTPVTVSLDPSAVSVHAESKTAEESVLDSSSGLKLIGGDAEIYRIVLKEYYNENIACAADLDGKIKEKDYNAAIQIVHKTKSSAGNIGAKALYEAASQLQKSLTDNDEISIGQWSTVFRNKLGKLLEEIDVFLK